MSEFDDEDLAGDVDDGLQLMVSQVPIVQVPAELIAFVDGPLQDRFTSAGKRQKKRWCVRWAEHPDAVHRLAAIYDEYQFMLLGGKGAPSLHMFIREVVDYHMPLLVDPSEGVFSQCDRDHTPHDRIDDTASKAAENAASVSTAWTGRD